MANVEIKLKGREALQGRLKEKRNKLISYLNIRLLHLAEDAVVYSKDNKGYKDRTGNLKNSISFALYLDGELITSQEGQLPKPEATEEGQQGVSNALAEYAQKEGVVAPKGYSLVIVAGMRYGKYVEENHSYNVLQLTKHYLREEMKGIFEEVINTINSDG
jgi:hypothetical protein